MILAEYPVLTTDTLSLGQGNDARRDIDKILGCRGSLAGQEIHNPSMFVRGFDIEGHVMSQRKACSLPCMNSPDDQILRDGTSRRMLPSSKNRVECQVGNQVVDPFEGLIDLDSETSGRVIHRIRECKDPPDYKRVKRSGDSSYRGL